MFAELNGKDCYERLRHLNLWTSEARRNRQYLIEVYKMYKGFTKMDKRTIYKGFKCQRY